ncbi:hypothetical protein [Nocardioides mesophilus]|uniref:Uncharacterized protein n=1 Tax=Nocardioides mesophilus TaxID=433659 RepID=A0A7G9R9V9_9ACTN|nr:hypothetical protein [Nocardioides mesophilus]QNN52384.1 hypothetical protein H9L09_18185 [Nocardioides mesophilus]
MGYTTDFIGHLDIRPALNAAEIGYLTAFTTSRRWRRPSGPYAVPPRPEEDEPAPELGHDFHVPADGQPGLWCDWQVCWDGCCLAYAGSERFSGVVEWLRYLLDHFLRPGAVVADGSVPGRVPAFDAFTFDHVLDGLVVGSRRDNKQLFGIEVVDNHVTEQVLRRADRRLRGAPPLPYETAIDRRRPAGAAGRGGQVLPFLQRPGA